MCCCTTCLEVVVPWACGFGIWGGGLGSCGLDMDNAKSLFESWLGVWVGMAFVLLLCSYGFALREPEGPRRTHKDPEGARGSQREAEGATREARGTQRDPEGPRGTHREPECARVSQWKPEGAKGSQKGPEGSLGLELSLREACLEP